MAKLIFYDNDHTYEVDGENFPSVSEISRFASREVYGEVSQYNLDVACERGSQVHKSTEILDKYKSCEVTEDIENYVRAYVQFKKDYGVGDYDYIEKPLANLSLKYAGTIDRILTITKEFADAYKENFKVDISHLIGKMVIIDLKSSYAVQKVLAKIQLNGYKLAVENNELGEVGLLCILHLKKDGTYKLMPFEIDDTLFMACLTLHNEFIPKRKKKEK
jgi:hypothetical protein